MNPFTFNSNTDQPPPPHAAPHHGKESIWQFSPYKMNNNFVYFKLADFLEEIATQYDMLTIQPMNHFSHHTTIGSFPPNAKICDPSLIGCLPSFLSQEDKFNLFSSVCVYRSNIAKKIKLSNCFRGILVVSHTQTNTYSHNPLS